MMHGRGKSDEAIVAVKPEQGRAICCGVGGAKGRGQGECAPSKHAPDTVPGSACHTRWPHAYHRVFDDAFGPEVGAV
jgi:hypothetical protein